MIEQFTAARRVGTPLICVRTPDPLLTVKLITDSCGRSRDGKENPIFIWDSIKGIRGISESAKNYAASKLAGNDTTNAVSALEAGEELPERSIFFICNAHRGVANGNWVQAVWNLREPYKTTLRTLVLLAPDVSLPAELAQDVLILDEPLPTQDELRKIVLSVLESANAESLDEAMVEKAVDATCGLAAFPAEQACAMSMVRDRATNKVVMKLEDLWARKRAMIEATPGLSVWRGGETFEDIGGCANIKFYLRKLLAGKMPPRAVLFIDEIEKALGTRSDTSGVSQSFLGTLLSYMEDTQASGMIFVGMPGSAKSMVAKATGNTAGIPTISFDLGGMKNSLVGESEARLRGALKVVTAVGQGRVMFVATCNSIAILPPELRRRFTMGTFYFPPPTKEERAEIWGLYLRKYELDFAVVEDEDWTGAEIKQCCVIASRLGLSLPEAAQFIVPVSKSAADQVAELAAQAHNRFICASYPGVYKHMGMETAIATNRLMEEIPMED